ncbi:MAG: DEAD/DEAH box helicase [Acidimicrobiales bacterium]
MSQTTFAELGLPSELVEVLDRKLIKEPFEIQSLAIPDAMVGQDILGRAPTGSGKTLAFGLPMLARLERGTKKLPRGLVLSPTRELAEQICRELEPLAAAMDRQVLAVYGGVGLDRQIRALRKGVDVLVACPGRLIDLINQKAVRLDDVDIVVVDEADRMADMGFLPDVRRLLDQTNDDRQTLLFSATLDKDVQVLIDKYQDDPAVHQVGEVEPDLSIVDHRFIKVKKTDRVWLAADLIADAGPTVIFVRTRHGVDRLARQLKKEGIKAGYIHGGRSQSQRDRALQVFTQGKVDALVATDVAARGIHVDGVACVIHYDPPADIKDYVHRSGRTARAGAEGTVVSFLDGPQVKESQKMQQKLALEGDIEPVPARQPRSSRPASFDDRDVDVPARNRSKKPRTAGSKSNGPSSRSSGRPDRSSKPQSKSKSSSKAKAKSSSAERFEEDVPPVGRNSRGKPAKRTKPGGTGTGKPSGRRATSKPGSKPAGKPGSKPGSRQSPKKRSTTRGRAGDSQGAESPRSTGDGSRPGGRKRTNRKAAAGGSGQRSTSKRRGSAKAAGQKPVSKRSGKPRPKNRKNKSKATGRK